MTRSSASPRDARVVIVSHVSPIKSAVGWALGTGPETSWRMFLATASITEVTIGPFGASLHRFNATAHLQGLEDG